MPHITNAIQDWIERVSKVPSDDTDEEPDVCIVEVSLKGLSVSGHEAKFNASSEEQLGTLNLLPSSKQCANFSSV